LILERKVNVSGAWPVLAGILYRGLPGHQLVDDIRGIEALLDHEVAHLVAFLPFPDDLGLFPICAVYSFHIGMANSKLRHCGLGIGTFRFASIHSFSSKVI
jgi:hypothetical protein